MSEEKFPTFEEFKLNLLQEKKEDQQYSYGCVMGYFSLSDSIDIELNDEDIYNNENNEYGKEIEPHVTLLYGLLDDQIDENEMIEFLSHLVLPSVTINQCTLFENEEFDVLKWDVESPALKVLNKAISSTYPNENKFPDYHAHETIAYMIHGTGKNYIKKLDEPIIKQIQCWVYSKADGKKIAIHTSNYSDVYVEELRPANKLDENI